VAQILAHIDFLDERLQQLDTEIGERERPFEEVLDRLDTIPGVARRVAEIIVAEIGPDVHRFPSPGHLASWAGLCPGQDESAGKRRSGKTRKGNRSCKPHLLPAVLKPTSRRSSAVSPVDEAPKRQPLPWPTPSYALSTTCSSINTRMRISANCIS